MHAQSGSLERCGVVVLTLRFCAAFQVMQVQDIPYTINGKRVEVPVKKVRSLRSVGAAGHGGCLMFRTLTSVIRSSMGHPSQASTPRRSGIRNVSLSTRLSAGR